MEKIDIAKKYKVTLKEDDQTLDTWLNHIQEELMDAVLYIQAAREELRDLSEEALIQKFSDDQEI